MDLPARYLLFNGSIILLVGLLCGAPYGTGTWSNKLVYVGNITGAASSLLGTCILVYAHTCPFRVRSLQNRLWKEES